jgi:hypothetical protein
LHVSSFIRISNSILLWNTNLSYHLLISNLPFLDSISIHFWLKSQVVPLIFKFDVSRITIFPWLFSLEEVLTSLVNADAFISCHLSRSIADLWSKVEVLVSSLFLFSLLDHLSLSLKWALIVENLTSV